MQGVGDIDKDIEAASLKALAVQSCLNSALTSVYARAPAPPEPAAEGAAAAEPAAAVGAQDEQVTGPAGAQALPKKSAADADATVSRQLPDLAAPGQQHSARQAEAAPRRQVAAPKEAVSQTAGTLPEEANPGMCIDKSDLASSV